MEELFLNKEHIARFNYMMEELGFTDLRDPYWRSLMARYPVGSKDWLHWLITCLPIKISMNLKMAGDTIYRH